MTIEPIPAGFQTITPYFLVEDVSAFLDFLGSAFDAVDIERVTQPDDSIAHAQVRIGDSTVMLGGARDQWKVMPMFMHLYVADSDGYYKRALAAGAASVREPKDEFYGDRSSGVRGLFGNLWRLATDQEDVSPEEIAKRAAAQGDEH